MVDTGKDFLICYKNFLYNIVKDQTMEELGKIIGLAGMVFLIALIISVPIWLLWNWLMPVIFGLTKITLLQALGICLLSQILFKSYNDKK